MNDIDFATSVQSARAELGSGSNSFVFVTKNNSSAVSNGSLAGLPIAVKDVIDCVDMPTAYGAYNFIHYPDTSATVVQRLVDAGAVVVGKTNTHQFAFGTTGDVSSAGPVTHPEDRSRMAGGSSSGSGTAVARGIVPVALGTDTAGSVRIPAAMVGCVGFKPTWNRLPLDGVMPLSPTLDVVGVLASSVEQLKKTWPVLSANESRVQTSTGELPIRFANLADHPQVRLSSRIREQWRITCKSLSDQGVELSDCREGIDLEKLRSLYLTIIGYESIQIHDPLLSSRPDIYDPQIRERIENLRGVTDEQYEAALDARNRERESVEQAFEAYDAIILPTVGIETPAIGQRDIQDDSGVSNAWGGLAELTNPWNVLGFPAISVPIPVTRGLPLGLQIVGKLNEDEKVIALAETVTKILGVSLSAQKATTISE
ncbi:amidase [Trueperella bialowiezensis]|uniref:Mandelamide hydrolase n=1 Tax=Trueperella bialowiezensis TaxID=312285 RepID=A0A448PDM9_9ACTO|nr:amidase [Trueperella bialowiezensis]VEI13024.1 Mandelamide hydrolase [Trueperella bialowiezensis]